MIQKWRRRCSREAQFRADLRPRRSMFSVPHLIIIFAVALVVFGPEKLPNSRAISAKSWLNSAAPPPNCAALSKAICATWNAKPICAASAKLSRPLRPSAASQALPRILRPCRRNQPTIRCRQRPERLPRSLRILSPLAYRNLLNNRHSRLPKTFRIRVTIPIQHPRK